MASSEQALFAASSERTCVMSYRENRGETFTYHINVTAMAAATGKSVEQLEPLLYSS